MPTIKLKAFTLLERVRTQSPVIHHLTNWVTIYDCAQVVKVLGASPVMAHAPEEVEEMVQLAAALVLNIGTLTVEVVEAMKLAARAANAKGIPVILDVCGAGATSFRDRTCFELLDEARIDLIKGNASEVARISGAQVRTKGVDAAPVEMDLEAVALSLALRRKCTVVITGPEDLVVDGSRRFVVKNGHPLMSRVVGTGCMAASVIGTFAAVEPDLALAAAAGLICFNVAGELAAELSPGPGSFKVKLFDCLDALDEPTLADAAAGERVRGYYFITEAALSRAGNLSDVAAAVAAGVRVVQYRQKQGLTCDLVAEARQLRQLCRHIRFLVNDRVDLALEVGADGVHLGQEDFSYYEARNLLGPDKIIGVTVHNVAEALAAQAAGADYLGVSPIFSHRHQGRRRRPHRGGAPGRDSPAGDPPPGGHRRHHPGQCAGGHRGRGRRSVRHRRGGDANGRRSGNREVPGIVLAARPWGK